MPIFAAFTELTPDRLAKFAPLGFSPRTLHVYGG